MLSNTTLVRSAIIGSTVAAALLASSAHAIPVRYSYATTLASPTPPSEFLQGYIEFDDSIRTPSHVFSPSDISAFEFTFGSDATWSSSAGDAFGTTIPGNVFFSLDVSLLVDAFFFCIDPAGSCVVRSPGVDEIPLLPALTTAVTGVGGGPVANVFLSGGTRFTEEILPVWDGGELNPPPMAVFEPTTLALLSFGLAALGFLLRQRTLAVEIEQIVPGKRRIGTKRQTSARDPTQAFVMAEVDACRDLFTDILRHIDPTRPTPISTR